MFGCRLLDLKAAQVAAAQCPYFGPSGDEQHQADHTFLQHHDEQVDATLTQPRCCLGRVTCRKEVEKHQ